MSNDDELARLARQGADRIRAANRDRASAADDASDYHLRVAIGAVRGSPLRRVFLVGAILGGVAFVGFIGLMIFVSAKRYGPFFSLAFLPGLGFFLTYLFVAPRATHAQVEAERKWIASLPFTVDGYFEALSHQPSYSCRLKLVLDWTGGPADDPTIQGVIGNLDTGAKVSRHGSRTVIGTGDISGRTGIRVNRVPVYRNHKLAQYLVQLVGDVLLPIHRSHAIAKVTIQRES